MWWNGAGWEMHGWWFMPFASLLFLVILIWIVWLLASQGHGNAGSSSGHEQETIRELQQEITKLRAEVEQLKRTRSAD